MTIYPNTIGSGFRIYHAGDFVHVGPNVRIGCNCTMLPGVVFGNKSETPDNTPVIVGDNCYFGLGVKIIGATAHFATEDLDQGPIICQDIQRVPETASIDELVELGKDIEKRTRSADLKLWLEHRVFVYAGRTFIL